LKFQGISVVLTSSFARTTRIVACRGEITDGRREQYEFHY
jgi:hypothetical protein